MDQGQHPDILQHAAHAAVSTAAASDDLAAALFPKSQTHISDRMVAYSRRSLITTVTAIEKEIAHIAIDKFGVEHGSIAEIAEKDRSYSYTLLENAGFLKSNDILDHIFVQAQRTELAARMVQKISQNELEVVLTRYLDDPASQISEAAMALLVAQGKENGSLESEKANFVNLPADVFHVLVWPVAAAIRKLSGYGGPHLADAASALLSGHDEGKSVLNCAHRLAAAVETSSEIPPENPHPLKDGLDLFLARLARLSGLDVVQIIKFTADRGMPRLIAVFKAAEFSNSEAMSIYAALEGQGQNLTAAAYDAILPDEARRLVRNWTANSAYQQAISQLESVDRGVAV